MKQTFWQKYKVFISGLTGAIIMALIPVLQPGTDNKTTIALIVMAVITATSSYLAKNLRGKAQSISGILFSVLVMVVPVLFAHGKLDIQNIFYVIISQVAVQFFGFSASPFKPSSYEHNEIIVEAKKIPSVNQVPIPDPEKKLGNQFNH